MLRASYEYFADAMTSSTFGSDGMPVICLFGVGLHEVSLTLMMTNISHPLIFGMLILCDILENTYCMWSLHRTIYGDKKKKKKKKKKKSSNKVAPHIIDEKVDQQHRKKTLTRRSTSMVKLIRDLDHTTSQEERRGTALFIAATLLQREMIETFVPLQAMCIISILHSLKVRSNSVVSGWSSDVEYNETMMYMSIDLGVEVIVFVLTILTLRSILPDVSAWRILSGVLRMHLYPMLVFMFGVWYVSLLFQNVMCGMDTTFRFSWLKCKGNENSTWLGGFDWECVE